MQPCGDGLFAVRTLIRPDEPEPVAVVLDNLRAGRIGNFHVFKWRLNMARHGDRCPTLLFAPR